MNTPRPGLATAPLRRRQFCAAAVALAGTAALAPHRPAHAQGLAAADAGIAAPPPGVQALDLDWLDTRRQRPVPVRLYLPEPAADAPAHAAAAPAPLVVFSHGLGGSRRGYSYLGRHFAQHGVASLHLQHVGSDRQLWGGNPLQLVGRLQGAAQPAEALARVQDLQFALDTLLAGPLANRVDAGRIVAAGHSYGANTTLLACGAQAAAPAFSPAPVVGTTALHDARVRAAILISAPPFYGSADLKPILGEIAVPTLHITATEDVIRVPGYYSNAADRVAVFEATGCTRQPPSPKWLAVFEGGSHSIFTDRAGTGGAVLNPQVKAATQALSLAFVQRVLGQDTGALDAWPQRHAPLLARYVAHTT